MIPWKQSATERQQVIKMDSTEEFSIDEYENNQRENYHNLEEIQDLKRLIRNLKEDYDYIKRKEISDLISSSENACLNYKNQTFYREMIEEFEYQRKNEVYRLEELEIGISREERAMDEKIFETNLKIKELKERENNE